MFGKKEEIPCNKTVRRNVVPLKELTQFTSLSTRKFPVASGGEFARRAESSEPLAKPRMLASAPYRVHVVAGLLGRQRVVRYCRNIQATSIEV